MPFTEQRTVASPTGAALRLNVRRGAGRPRGVVQINHGLAEHSQRYERFADFLAEHGFDSYAHDHRGHGLTTAPRAPTGMFGQPDGWKLVLGDVDAIRDLIAQERPGVPVITFGHSMGGLIALNHVLSRPQGLAGAAVWNANFSAGLAGRLAIAVLAWERFRLGSDAPSRILPRMTFRAWARQMPERRTEADWLSRDRAEVDRYVADPLCGWDASVSLWRDLFALIFRGAEDGNFARLPRSLPFNLVGGANDPATSGGRAVTDLARRLQAMGFSSIRTTIYPDTRHESLNEVNRDTVMADFAAWADQLADGAA